MGRAPCCDKANVKKGPWSPEEDAKLKSYIEQHGTGGNWIALPQKIGLKRCGKSCRLRWLNYLRPNLKHGGFSEEEENIICNLYISIGSRWSVIAAHLPGRTDNDIKNYWNTRLKKKLLGNNTIKHPNNNKQHHQKQYQQPCIRGGSINTNNVISKQESNYKINRGISDCGCGGGGDYCGDSLLSLLVPQNSITQENQQNPCNWSQIMMPMLQPVPHTNQQLLGNCCFNNDQDSIKKLLINLGGRYSSCYDDGDCYYHPTLDNGFNNPHQFQEQIHVGSSICNINNINGNNNEVHFAKGFGVGDNGFDELLVHGQGSFINNATIDEEMMMVSTNFFPQRLNGLEFFYGDHAEGLVNDDKIIIRSTSNTSYSNFSPFFLF